MSAWANPLVAMSSVTLTAPPPYTLGSAIDLEAIQNGYLLVDWIEVQSGDSWNVGFQGSMDSTNWYDVGGDNVGSLGGVGLTETIGPIVTVGTTPARYIRLTGWAASGSPVLSGLVAQQL